VIQDGERVAFRLLAVAIVSIAALCWGLSTYFNSVLETRASLLRNADDAYGRALMAQVMAVKQSGDLRTAAWAGPIVLVIVFYAVRIGANGGKTFTAGNAPAGNGAARSNCA